MFIVLILRWVNLADSNEATGFPVLLLFALSEKDFHFFGYKVFIGLIGKMSN